MNYYPGGNGGNYNNNSNNYNYNNNSNSNAYPGPNQYPAYYNNNNTPNAYGNSNTNTNNTNNNKNQNTNVYPSNFVENDDQQTNSHSWNTAPTPGIYANNDYNQQQPSLSSGNHYPGGFVPNSTQPPQQSTSSFNWYPGSDTFANYQPAHTRHQPPERSTSWHNPLGRYGNYTHQVPEGYEVRHTHSGMPYLVHKQTKKPEGQEDEDWTPPKLFGATKHIREAYGLGIWLYFDFVKNFIIVNFVLFLLQLINVINFIVIAPSEFATLSLDPRVYGSLFYASAYPVSMRAIWRATNSLCIVVAFVFPVFYWLRVRRIYSKLNEVDTEEEIDFGEFDIIEENKDFPASTRRWRFVVTYSTFIVLLVLQIGLVSLLILAQNSIGYVFVSASDSDQHDGGLSYYISSRPVTYLISFAVALVTAGLNFLWGWLCGFLTDYESHTTWTAHRKHHTVKLVSFKLLNVFFMSTVRGIFTQGCPLEIFGQQFLIQMVTDIVVFNTIEMLMPVLKRLWKKWRKGKVEEEDKPEFDTAEEYLEVLYRQHILYLALPAFPMMSFLVFIASILELYLDKFRLIRISQRPPRTQGSLKTFLAIFLIVAAILALANPGAGVIYLLAGRYWCVRGSNDEMCAEQPNRVCQIMQDNPTFTEISL